MRTRSAVQVNIDRNGVITETSVSATGLGTHIRWIHPDSKTPSRVQIPSPPSFVTIPEDPCSSFSSDSTSDSGEFFSSVDSSFSSSSSITYTPLQHHEHSIFNDEDATEQTDIHSEEQLRLFRAQLPIMQELEAMQKCRFEAYAAIYRERLRLQGIVK